MRPLLVLAVVVAPLFAQATPPKVDARWFLPRDHERLVVVDFAALRETDFWACMHTEVWSLVERQLDRRTGVPLARVDRLTWVGDMAKPENGPVETRIDGVLVLEGNGPLGDPATDCEDWESERLGGFACYWIEGYSPDLRCWPGPELFVCGTASVLRSVLRAPRQPGLPAVDVMSLSASREKPLAFAASRVTEHDGLPLLTSLLPGVAWPAGKAPTHLALRVGTVADPEEEGELRIVLRATVRHAAADAGVAETAAAVRARLDALRKDRRLTMLHAVLRAIVVECDGIDLHVLVDCGRERDAAALVSFAVTVGQLASLLPGDAARIGARPPGIRDIPGSEVDAEVGGR
jgi:hypothetical protein